MIKRKITALKNDKNFREIFEGTIASFTLKIFGSGLAFLFNILVARLLGADGAGIYYLALAVSVVASILGRIGLDNTLLRSTSRYAVRGEWGKVRGIFNLAMKLTIILSGLLTVFLYLSAPAISEIIFNKPELSAPLRWMSLSILPFAILNLQAESLKGLKHIREAMIVQTIGLPLLSILLVVPLSRYALTIGVVWAYVIASFIVVLLGWWFWRNTLRVQSAGFEQYTVREVWGICRNFFAIALMGSAFLPFAPVFFVGAFGSSVDVGVLSVASRVAALVSLLLATINNVTAPKFSELYSKGDIIELERSARSSSLLIACLASPIILVLLIKAELVMGIFGPGFESGSKVLLVLMIGQSVNLLTGSSGYLLMMSGFENEFKKLTIVSISFLLLFSFLLVPTYGAYGAAIATSIAMVFLNIGSLWVIDYKLGIRAVFWLPHSNRN